MSRRNRKWYFAYTQTVVLDGRKVQEEVKIPLGVCTEEEAIAEGKAELACLRTREQDLRKVQSKWLRPPTGPFIDGIRDPYVFQEILL